MRHTANLCLAFGGTLFPIGCGAMTAPAPVTHAKASSTDEMIRAAEKATAAVAEATRDDFVRAAGKRLDELDAKYKTLEHRAAEAKDDARKELDELLKATKVKRDAAVKRLDELKAAHHDRWEKVKASFENAFQDLKRMFE